MSAPSLSNVFSDVYITGNCTVKGTISSLAGSITSQWTTSGSIIYYTSGNVGIGTTNPQNSLTVYNSGVSISNLSSGTTSTAAYYAVVNTADNRRAFVGMDGTGLFAFSTGALALGTDNTPIIFAPSYGSGEKMRILTTGYVGIGTTNPGSLLTVSGGVGIGSGYQAFTAPTGGLIVQGNVGIGTTNPGLNALQVTGNVVTSGFTSNATNTVFNFDTLTVPFVNATQIGIGNTTPPVNLWTQGTSTTTGIGVYNADVAMILGNTAGAQNAGSIQVRASGSSSAIGATNYSLCLNPDGGNVGVGVAALSYKFHVNGGAIGVTGTNNYLYYAVTNSTASGAYMMFDAQTAGGSGRRYQIGSTGTGDNPGTGCFELYDATGSATRVVVNASGNVGIGTTNPGNTLDVYQSVNGGNSVRAYNPNTGTGAYGGFIMGTNDSSNRGGIVTFNSTLTASAQYRASGTYVYCNGAGGITLHAEGANNLFFATNSVERMRVTSAGNVGVGTTDPQFRLNSSQDISETGDINPNTAQFAVTGATTPGKRMVFGYDTQTAGNGYGFIKAGNLAVTWTNISLQPNGGNVGIGVTNPVSKLTVPQLSTATVVIGGNTNWSGSSGVLKVTGASGQFAPIGTTFGASVATDNHWEIVNGNGQVGAVRTSGSTTTYNSLSDYRTKTNVQPLSNALVIISQMKPVRFNFKADLNKDIEGFIAHELQECAPNAVTGEKDAVFADGSINPQCIDMSFLVPFLVAGMQDLSAENKDLKTQLAAMDARLAALEAK